MSVNNPLVTVGVAVYNHQDYIKQCIESILEQDYDNIEVIIIDDGSTDKSVGVVQAYLKERGYPRQVELSTRPNQGMCNTLNEIARKSQGKYISYIGSDDYWLSNKLSDQVAYLETHPECTLVHSNSSRVDSQGQYLKDMDYSTRENSGNVFEALIKRTGGINTPSHLYRTCVFDEIGYYDPQFRFEDTDFWLRLTKNHPVGYINKTHTCYRWHGENLSSQDNKLKFYFDELIAIYEKNIDDPALRQYAIRRVCRKAIAKSIKAMDFVSTKKFVAKLFA